MHTYAYVCCTYVRTYAFVNVVPACRVLCCKSSWSRSSITFRIENYYSRRPRICHSIVYHSIRATHYSIILHIHIDTIILHMYIRRLARICWQSFDKFTREMNFSFVYLWRSVSRVPISDEKQVSKTEFRCLKEWYIAWNTHNASIDKARTFAMSCYHSHAVNA